jgi:serine/threonine protein kinase
VLYSCKDRAWKIADFGIATEGSETTENLTYVPVGTFGYRAPELLDFHSGPASYTNKVDIWALGCVLYELVTARKPLEVEERAQQLYLESRSPTVKNTTLGLDMKFDGFSELEVSSLTKTALRMLKIDSSTRPTAPEMSEEFRTLLYPIPTGIRALN